MFRKLTAEWLGTFSLLATVVGSGIMAERLADGNVAAALAASFFGWFLANEEAEAK